MHTHKHTHTHTQRKMTAIPSTVFRTQSNTYPDNNRKECKKLFELMYSMNKHLSKQSPPDAKEASSLMELILTKTQECDKYHNLKFLRDDIERDRYRCYGEYQSCPEGGVKWNNAYMYEDYQYTITRTFSNIVPLHRRFADYLSPSYVPTPTQTPTPGTTSGGAQSAPNKN